MRWSVAIVWLATGVLVLSPHYRAIGMTWLDRLGLGSWAMISACFGEVVLAVVLFVKTMRSELAWLQTALVLGFTAVLAWLEPMLLVHPFGVLTNSTLSHLTSSFVSCLSV